MPNRVHLLDETVANRIAAGEVVDRPASVLKELLDNALDAEARRVEVEIEKGGKSLVRVTDDGWGMSYDDALLSLERSATSKILKAEDLLNISTMGFRGEALPSIASVSRFKLLTRERGSDVGTQIVVDGGKIRSVSEAGCPTGTQIEVRSLFLHVPARRKFLRADATEWAHVEQVFRLSALGYPGVSFQLKHDQAVVAAYPAAASLEERLGQVFGKRWIEDTLSLESDRGDFRLRGVIGRPGVSRSSRQEHHLFVNHRPVQSPTLNYALLEGYHNTLMKGRFPVAVLFLEIPPELVDVNVHPSKKEVRFREEQNVRDFVTGAVRETLKSKTSEPMAVGLGSGPGRVSGDAAPEVFPPVSAAPIPEWFTPEKPATVAAMRSALPVLPFATEEQAPLKSVFESKNHDLHVLGVIMNLYVVAENPEGVVLIDQHAAHERVLFEQMLERVAREEVLSQRLLLPVTVELPPEQADFLRGQIEGLNQVGLSVADLGNRTFMVDGLPPMIKTQAVEDFFRAMLVDLQQEGGRVRQERRLSEEIIAKTVCRHAVKANDSLSLPEVEKLLVDLHACELPYTCPHGRPTMILISKPELEKKFGRVA